MKITVEIEVYYDFGAKERVNRTQLKDEIESAVSGCEGIENVASVQVKKISVRTGDKQ
jgi:hypothetical protein